MIEFRKDDHIRISILENVETGNTYLDCVYLIHQALPEIKFEDINLEVEVFNKKLSAPVIIGALTGGTELGFKINKLLAQIAEKFNIGLYVGSQRIAIEKKETRYTFEIVKEIAPNVLKIANLGAVQISKIDESKLLDLCNEAIDMINADALSIHLNPLQEILQPEGEPYFQDFLSKLNYLIKHLNKPIIVKEVGFGISKEVAEKLEKIKVHSIDIAGFGGTSFTIIEGFRSNKFMKEISKTFINWGLPTLFSLCEVLEVFNGIIIASGGIRNGIDIIKVLAIGANVVSVSRPFLENALLGFEKLENYVNKLLMEMKIAMYLTNAKSINDLKNIPIVFCSSAINWFTQRKLRKCIKRIYQK